VGSLLRPHDRNLAALKLAGKRVPTQRVPRRYNMQDYGMPDTLKLDGVHAAKVGACRSRPMLN